MYLSPGRHKNKFRLENYKIKHQEMKEWKRYQEKKVIENRFDIIVDENKLKKGKSLMSEKSG